MERRSRRRGRRRTGIHLERCTYSAVVIFSIISIDPLPGKSIPFTSKRVGGTLLLLLFLKMMIESE